MSDRPSAINGRRDRAWGTRDPCPACGRCLCFGYHPAGPCVDEHDHAAASDRAAGASANLPSSVLSADSHPLTANSYPLTVSS
jgi:hypothetical protein